MANFYLDTPSLRHHLHHPLMRRIVELKEREFRDKDEYDYAPIDFDDAMDSYERVLEMVGEISAEVIAPNAESVDREGPTVANGRVTYARGTQENLDAVRKAGLMGMAMPRRYGGLNFPIVPYIMAADIVSRADAGFENLWGLQDCAETLYEFGNEEQHKHYIPRVCKGETMSMDLTEPDAGSDLQSVMLKATFDEKENCWRLNGVKRFITNGDSDIHLVLARSEEGTKDGRGLSMFIYDKRNGGVNVRRIENKMGIKGSPTCELVFSNAKAELCGERRLGLIKYVMALMNGARLGIMAQAVGLCEAAYQEGYKYAQERRQATAFVKSRTGRLSSTCGCAFAAGAGAAAGLTWLMTDSIDRAKMAVQAVVSNLIGMLCDGAKETCAFKVGTGAMEAYHAALMAASGNGIATQGVVGDNIEQTIENAAKVASNMGHHILLHLALLLFVQTLSTQ